MIMTETKQDPMQNVTLAPDLVRILPSWTQPFPPHSLVASLAVDPFFNFPLGISPLVEQTPPFMRPFPVAPSSTVLLEESAKFGEFEYRRPFREHCEVCGDRATGLHYSVASCNGCKTFFRRTIICNRSFKCNKDGNCDFNKDMRCACRSCRFQKCVRVGMNPAGVGDFEADGFSLFINMASHHSLLFAIHVLCKSRPVNAFAIGVAECDEMISAMLNIDVRMSQLKSLQFAGGPLLDLLTSPPAIECMGDIQPSSPPSSFASDEKRIEHWLNYELTIATEWMKTHAVFRKLTFFDKCMLMEDTMVAVVLLNSAFQAALRGERELRYPDGSAMRFSHKCGGVSYLVDAIVRSPMNMATFVLMRALTFLNPDSFGLTPDGHVKIHGERRRVMHALGTYIFHRHGTKSPGILGDVLALPGTALALGRRIRLSPPASAPLLFVKGPLPTLKS